MHIFGKAAAAADAAADSSFTHTRLTEEDTEYSITVVKHIFPEHLVLQFDCANTIAEQQLEAVSVAVDADAAVRHP